MIPYDDLVAALTTWRARQGLPVATGAAVPGSVPTPIPMTTPASGPLMTGSGPTTKPGSGPQRATPPMAPPKGGGYQPPPLASPEGLEGLGVETADDSLDVDDSALLEEAHYEADGADFALGFAGAVENDGESTTLGHAPEAPARDSFGGETELDPKSRKPW